MALVKTRRELSCEDEPAAKRIRFQSYDGTDDATFITSSSPRSLVHTDTDSRAETSTTSTSTRARPKVFICEYEGCTKAFDRPVRLEAHIRTHTNERPFICQEDGCTKRFFKLEHLRAHHQNKHGGEATFACDYVSHLRKDGEEVPCGKRFTTGTRLRRHKAMHEEREQTKCRHPGCGQVFRKMDTLQRHVKKDHLQEDAFRCRHIINDESSVTEECGQTFPTAGKLRAHENREHTSKSYTCEICSPFSQGGEEEETSALSTFPTYAQLQHHKKSVHPPTCGACGHACPSNRALAAHMEIEHSSLSSRQKFKCEYPGCDRGFTRKGNLSVHYQTVHVKLKHFICGKTDLSESKKVEGWDGHGCGVGFGTKASLEGHVRTQHLNRPLGNARARRTKPEGRAVPSDDSRDVIETDELTAAEESMKDQSESTKIVAMLTGFGYEEQRPIACWSSDCTVRFMRSYDLARHVELTHGWNIDDINDRLVEEEALAGGKFWLGGAMESMDLDSDRAELCDKRKIEYDRVQRGRSDESRHHRRGRIANDDTMDLDCAQSNFDNAMEANVLDPRLLGV